MSVTGNYPSWPYPSLGASAVPVIRASAVPVIKASAVPVIKAMAVPVIKAMAVLVHSLILKAIARPTGTPSSHQNRQLYHARGVPSRAVQCGAAVRRTGA